MTTPYLSIVLGCRNDDHLPDMLRRLQVSVSGLLEQVERHKLVSELILVDWNPPANRSLLKDALSWPVHADFCTVRVIEVPPALHRRCPFSDKLGYIGNRAPNVGIRRARGQFVLATNTHLMFSDALAQFLAADRLQADRMYRIDRYDVKGGAMQLPSLDARLAYCESNILEVHGKYGSLPTDGSGPELPLHTGACGDFTLLSRDLWHNVHGFPEPMDYHSVYFDGLLCYMAYAAGAKEEVLRDPMRIYRIGHQSIWRAEKSWLERLASHRLVPERLSWRLAAVARRIAPSRSRIERLGVPVIDYGEYQKMCAEIVEGKRPFVYNDESWGLGGEELPETVVVRARWDSQVASAQVETGASTTS